MKKIIVLVAVMMIAVSVLVFPAYARGGFMRMNNANNMQNANCPVASENCPNFEVCEGNYEDCPTYAENGCGFGESNSSGMNGGCGMSRGRNR